MKIVILIAFFAVFVPIGFPQAKIKLEPCEVPSAERGKKESETPSRLKESRRPGAVPIRPYFSYQRGSCRPQASDSDSGEETKTCEVPPVLREGCQSGGKGDKYGRDHQDSCPADRICQ